MRRQSLHPNWGVRKQRWVQGRLDDQLSDSRRGGQARIAEVSWSGVGGADLSASAIAGAALAESGPLTKLIFPFSAGGGGKTLCRIPAQHRDLVDRGRIPGVLQHVRGRALDRPGFCQRRAAAWRMADHPYSGDPLDHGVRVCFYLLRWQQHNMVE
jgi:hypothetical protein